MLGMRLAAEAMKVEGMSHSALSGLNHSILRSAVNAFNFVE
jgi:hypothetical protein